MRIVRWVIDGFGVFSDYDAGELPDGLTLVMGPNEAGKTTLLAFLRGVLFGFRDRRSGQVYPPLRGGRHGGRIVVQARDGLYSIQRDAGGRRKPVITLPSGEQGGEADLQRLLGNADQVLFENVFAFSLAELQAFDSLDRESISNRVFSASLVGAGESAQTVIEKLESAAAELYAPRRKDGAIEKALGRLDALDVRLREARIAAAGYAQVLADEDDAAGAVDALREAQGERRAAADRLETLVGLWPTWVELQQAEHDLADPPPVPDAAARRPPVEDLYRQVELQRHRLATLPTLRARVAQTDDEARDRIALLGAEWTEEGLATVSTSLPSRDQVRAWQSRLEEAARSLASADQEARAAERLLAAARAAHERLTTALPEQEPPSAAELDARTAALARLRAAPAGATARWSAGPLTAVSAFMVAALLAALGVWQALRPDAWAAVGLLLAAAGAALLGRRLRGGAAPPPPSADWTALGFDHPPSPLQLETAWTELTTQREARRSWDLFTADLRAAAGRTADAEHDCAERLTEHDDAGRALQTLDVEWLGWKHDAGVPEQLTPAGVVDFFDAVAAARDQCDARDRAHAELQALSANAREWEQRAADALGPHAPAAAGGDALVATLIAFRDRLDRQAQLEAVVSRGTQAIDTRLGHGPHADALRAELAGGDVAEWRERLQAQRLAVEEADKELESAIERRRDIHNRRLDLEASADVAALDGEREAIAAELADLAARWRVAALARSLVAATLQRYAALHQPAVLARASELFAQVTAGRYEQVLQEGEKRGIVVRGADGSRKAVADLSRGTAEQLYLCIRLSFAEEFARFGTELPLIMDDVLVNFDPRRAAAVAGVLAGVARQRQVLLFTCHPATRDMLADALGDKMHVVEMDAPGA